MELTSQPDSAQAVLRTCRLTLIVAMGRNRVIGRDNGLPWRIPEDLAYLKRVTMGHALIMGRTTFESIGRPLPGRRTIVVTRQTSWHAPGTETADSLARAWQICSAEEEAFVAGGAALYEEGLLLADRLLITEIDREYAGDTFFPAIPATFRESKRERHTAGADPTLHFDFVTYLREDAQRANDLP
jgi:dihydrofolate reductase